MGWGEITAPGESVDVEARYRRIRELEQKYGNLRREAVSLQQQASELGEQINDVEAENTRLRQQVAVLEMALARAEEQRNNAQDDARHWRSVVAARDSNEGA